MQIRKRDPKRGDCFETAGRLARDLGGTDTAVRLIHAQVHGRGKMDGVRFWHAWVEKRGFALDIANGLCVGMRVDSYRAAALAINVREYEVTQAMVLALESGHWGPWGEGNYESECERCGRELPACECEQNC